MFPAGAPLPRVSPKSLREHKYTNLFDLARALGSEALDTNNGIVLKVHVPQPQPTQADSCAPEALEVGLGLQRLLERLYAHTYMNMYVHIPHIHLRTCIYTHAITTKRHTYVNTYSHTYPHFSLCV